MNRMTFAALTVALAASGAQAVRAQDPTPPARPASPKPAPAPRARPRPAPAPRIDPEFMVTLPPMSYAFDLDAEALRDQMRAAGEALKSMDNEQFREQMRDAKELAKMASTLDQFGDFAPVTPIPDIPPIPAVAPMVSVPPMALTAPMSFGAWSDRLDRLPPAPWAQGDPADSLYRVARDALSRGDYGRSAQMFAELQQKYPKSTYATNAPYWEAMARYKIGTTEELKAAARALEPLASKVTQSGTNGSPNYVFYIDGQRRMVNDAEVSALYTRINGTLAQRGDRDAAAKIEKAASQNGGAVCDPDEMSVKTEALNALSQMDPATSVPLLKRVLDRKDQCTAQLRRSAIFMLGRRGDADSYALIANVAKTDPDVNVRIEAINFLAKQPGDAGISTLEDILRTDQDERVQRAAIRSLTSSDNPRARTSMRSLIERKDVSINQRIEAVSAFNTDRTTPEDAAYLRNTYPKVDNDRVREAIINAVARIGGPDNDRWLLTVASNQNESGQLRTAAISRLYRSPNITVADLSKLYDAADSYSLRQQIINALQLRKEPEATDKLVDIAKNSTDVNIRREALRAIQRSNDPRRAQLLIDIIDGSRKP
ncbi:MAG TPA: HEAT repeat domain-containing protein [Gemmatimonadaceae bacterium]|nr:HEAT repeat domain-containing protein [Gemmatimonadaceae bacterium]